MEIIEACSSNSSLNEDIVYISIGCSVEAIESIDQQFPRGLSKFANIQDKTQNKAKIWLFDPKFWNVLPLFLRSPVALHNPRHDPKEMIKDLRDDFKHVSKNLYQKENLWIQVCPYYFEKKASFFDCFTEYLRSILKHNGQVHISVFTQPYLKVEENFDVVTMYNDLTTEFLSIDSAFKLLHYHHLAEYGTATQEKKTLVWNIDPGQIHDQDEALIREVARFEGEGPTFGCGCYAAFPGTKFVQSIHTNYGHDYDKLHQMVQKEVQERGGSKSVLTKESFIDDIVFEL